MCLDDEENLGGKEQWELNAVLLFRITHVAAYCCCQGNQGYARETSKGQGFQGH